MTKHAMGFLASRLTGSSRFKRSYREAVLDMYIFRTLVEVREYTERWLEEYNGARPHESLGNMTPREYLITHEPEVSSYGWY